MAIERTAEDKAKFKADLDRIESLLASKIIEERRQAEAKAWDALSRYKFQMFGYWAAIWVHLNRLAVEQQPNPWKELVDLARNKQALEGAERAWGAARRA